MVCLTRLSFMQNRNETHNIKIACPRLHIGRGIVRVKTEPPSFSKVSLSHQPLISYLSDGDETILMKTRYPEFVFTAFTLYPSPFCSGIFFSQTPLFLLPRYLFLNFVSISTAIWIFPLLPLLHVEVYSRRDLEAFFCQLQPVAPLGSQSLSLSSSGFIYIFIHYLPFHPSPPQNLFPAFLKPLLQCL